MGRSLSDQHDFRDAGPARRIDGRGSFDFASAYQASYRVLWVIAAGVANRPDLAEDIVHEAAVQALGKLDQFKPGTDFTAWMAQIVRFVARNAGRAYRKHRAAPLEALGSDGGPARQANPAVRLSPDGRLPEAQHHFDDDMMTALNSLSDEARACLLLRTLEDLPYTRISQVLGIPQGTAMSHVHRSRRQLRQQLGAAGNPARTGKAQGP